MPKHERIGYVELGYKEIIFGQDDQALMESFKKRGESLKLRVEFMERVSMVC